MSFPQPSNFSGAPAPTTLTTPHPHPQPQAYQQQHTIGTAPPSNTASFPLLSASTEEILKRVSANGGASPGWLAAREHVLQRMVTSQDIPTPPPSTSGRGRGRGGAGGSGRWGAPAASSTAGGAPTTTSATPRRGSSAANAAALAGSGSPATATAPSSARGRGRGRGAGGKRGGRRKRAKQEEDSDVDDEITSGNSSNSETLTSFPTKTKSGRRVHRPMQFDPATKTPTRRRGPYRRMAEATVCRTCQRGHSVPHNMIVFCDGCNTPYHQYCHDPPIDDEVVRVEEKEWLCMECLGVKSKPLLAGVGMGMGTSASAGGIGEVDLRTAVSGEGLSAHEKRTYFTLLPIPSLINILMHATMVHPDLAIFAPDAKSQVTRFLATQKKAVDSNPTTTTTITPSQLLNEQQPTLTESQIQNHDFLPPPQPQQHQQQQALEPQHPQELQQQPPPKVPYFPYQHYPKPGNGLRLPFLTTDELALLVDDDLDAFTHLYHGVPVMDRGYAVEHLGRLNPDSNGNGNDAGVDNTGGAGNAVPAGDGIGVGVGPGGSASGGMATMTNDAGGNGNGTDTGKLMMGMENNGDGDGDEMMMDEDPNRGGVTLQQSENNQGGGGRNLDPQQQGQQEGVSDGEMMMEETTQQLQQ
ncbi:MAG: transcription factor TFIIIB subunit brf1 [Watsoniomyces obsoletus]|nr:MAG: transcription factor TFIIIB subunit brf1 [Watsoniomyces obsoletus]